MSDDWRAKARKLPKGNLFDDFQVGQVFEHHWGRTLNEGDNALFFDLTLSLQPALLQRAVCACAWPSQDPHQPNAGIPDRLRAVGRGSQRSRWTISGVDNLIFHRQVYPGATLVARSIVTDKRESQSRPDSGIVNVAYEGFLADATKP